MATYEYIRKRLDKLEADRGTWESHWQEILDYVMPRKAEITFLRSRGEKRTEVLFDSTAITANNLLAASLQGTLTSPSLPWFSLKLRDDDRYTNNNYIIIYNCIIGTVVRWIGILKNYIIT